MSRIWLCIVVTTLSIPVASLVNRIVPDPYMDEIFHIPQMKHYCKGNFGTWDPMITTPPGLYLATYIYTSILHPGVAASLWSDSCSTAVLRHVNVIFSIICAVLFREIILHLEPASGPIVASLKALALSCYPLHWFFAFLFYTDVGSTTAVLAMYLACLKRAYWTSALLSLVAIWFRQTNVVWTFFVLCVGIFDFLFKPSSSVTKSPLSVDKSFDKDPITENSENGLRATYQSSNIKSGVKNANAAKGLMEEILYILQQGWQKRSALVRHFVPFALPILCFLVFVAYNGSIVLGAKEAHKASPHFAQVLYFSAIAALALAPIHINPCFIRENLLKFNWMQSGPPGYFFAALIGVLASIHYFSLAHPYLVSDNRHYTFYIWRRIINVHRSSKYLLSIIYVYSWWVIFKLLGRKERKIWLLTFFGAVVAVLVPAPLMEFRYYTVPFYLVALHTPSRTPKDYFFWVLIFLQYSVVNLVTMYIFLYRPFFTPSWEGIQRFIW